MLLFLFARIFGHVRNGRLRGFLVGVALHDIQPGRERIDVLTALESVLLTFARLLGICDGVRVNASIRLQYLRDLLVASDLRMLLSRRSGGAPLTVLLAHFLRLGHIFVVGLVGGLILIIRVRA